MSYDHIWHLAELLPIAFACWRMFRAANRILDVMKDFPPHRHINGSILYPSGFAPSAIEKRPVT
jgi:hypothetical protein